MSGTKSSYLEIVLALVVLALGSALTLSGSTAVLDQKIFDSLLHFRPAPQEDPRLAIIAIDNAAIDLGGTFPWSRDITARGLLLLRELGVERITFDIEFLNPSPFGVNKNALGSNMADSIRSEVNGYRQQVMDFMGALAEGSISPADALEFLPALDEEGTALSLRISDQVGSLVQDNDRILAQSFKVFGKAYGTLNNKIEGNEEDPLYQEALAHALAYAAAKNLSVVPDSLIPQLDRLTPPIPAIARAAENLGYTNMEPDADGVTRRVIPLGKFNDQYFLSLSLHPLLDLLGNPPLVANGTSLVIRLSALDPARKDITVPLDQEGAMLINWTHQPYESSFKNVSFGELIRLERLESGMVDLLETLSGTGALELAPDPLLLERHKLALDMKDQALAAGDEEMFGEYIQAKRAFFAGIEELATSTTLVNLLGRLDRVDATAPEEQKADLARTRTLLVSGFAELSSTSKEYQATWKRLNGQLAGSFAIIGQTGTATTDLGVTPFESTYMNVGVHLNVANTILQGQFLQQEGPLTAILISVIATLLLVMVVQNMAPLRAAIVSFIALALVLSGLVAVFLVTGIFAGIFLPLATLFVCALGISLIKFRVSEKEKGFIRGAFARYLSDEVIKDIVANPKALDLGGAKKNLTAIFTDVKGFSTISEKLDPTDLVKLLNEYLSAMSDIILDLGGFIDKYEGDAIIAFWGAPVPHEDHARRACLAALRMRARETELNRHFLDSSMSPSPLLTRIGINTGDIVVGNMGTERRLNYTIMGNAVNLAARLEGVNKQYGTWILISEYTRARAGEDFLYRSLDRVRVVGINTPVRLYEVVSEKEQCSPAMRKTVAYFEKGMELFESARFVEAEAQFNIALELSPEDLPSKVFLERCAVYRKAPPPKDWDAVFNLTSK